MCRFDPYYKWFGIPKRDQPPNHYRLLGIELFESDPDVIDAAAEQRIEYLRRLATGTHIAESQMLLNEVATARLCLLNSEAKRAYDANWDPPRTRASEAAVTEFAAPEIPRLHEVTWPAIEELGHRSGSPDPVLSTEPLVEPEDRDFLWQIIRDRRAQLAVAVGSLCLYLAITKPWRTQSGPPSATRSLISENGDRSMGSLTDNARPSSSENSKSPSNGNDSQSTDATKSPLLITAQSVAATQSHPGNTTSPEASSSPQLQSNERSDVLNEAQRSDAQPQAESARADGVGRQLCWEKGDWQNGLPLLAKSEDLELAKLAILDMAKPVLPSQQLELADAWLAFAHRQAVPSARSGSIKRATFWYELASSRLVGVERDSANARLDFAYAELTGRNLRQLLLGTPNGVHLARVTDCAKAHRNIRIDAKFNVSNSWLLAFQFRPTNFNSGSQQVFFWGDNRPGRDPIFVCLKGARLDACTQDSATKNAKTVNTLVDSQLLGKWIDLKLLHEAKTRELVLYFDHRLIRRERMLFTPLADRVMPAAIGGAVDGSQRFVGQVRELWLGNIP